MVVCLGARATQMVSRQISVRNSKCVPYISNEIANQTFEIYD